MFKQAPDSNCSFVFDEFDDSMVADIKEWFLRIRPLYVMRTLVNGERINMNSRYMLTFETEQDATLFKLTFL